MRRPLLVLLLSVLPLLSAAPAAALVDPGTGTTYEAERVVVPLTFPVAGSVRFSDNWLACRSGCARMHMGQDLMGAKMLPLVAAFDGVVTSVKREATPNSGGNTLTIAADRGPAAGWSALYVHVNNDTPGTDDGRGTAAWSFPAGIAPGARVLAGQLVGWLGDSGNAESTGAHLHVELRKGDGWRGVVYNAYPTLMAARRLSAPLPSGPHPEGSLLRHPTGRLFVLQGGDKRELTPASLAAHGRLAVDAVPMTAAESVGYRTGAAALIPDGTIVRDPGATTWLVTGGGRAKAGAAAWAALGRPSPRVHRVTHADLAPLPVVPLPESPLYSGALVRAVDSRTIHLVDATGTLRRVGHAAVLTSHGWTFQDVAVLPAGALQEARTGAPLGLRDGTLVRTDTNMVLVISGGTARRLHDTRQSSAYGYAAAPRMRVPDGLVAHLPVTELTTR
ncbi:MAG: N-acetylmuramoyl-L-alanine amidase [Frankiales bacterium]|nr:N-acetylmuramoyl-L-alanine amidase [Frankiales bacterium]